LVADEAARADQAAALLAAALAEEARDNAAHRGE